MSITSVGYTGSVDESSWAVLATFAGTDYAVLDPLSLQCVIGGSGDRAVTVAAGTAYGRGVADVSSAPTNLNATILASGVRWDTVCLRRDWSAGTGTGSSLVIVAGTSTKQITRTHATPGVTDDQPLALLRIDGGSGVVTLIEDLRALAGKSVVVQTADAVSELFGLNAGVLQAGARFFALDNLHEYVFAGSVFSGADTYKLIDLDDPGYIPWTSTFGLGGTSGLYVPFDVQLQFGSSRGWAYLRGTLQRSDGNALMGIGSTVIGVLPVPYRPAHVARFICFAGPPGTSSGPQTYVNVSITSDGTVTLVEAAHAALPAAEVAWVAFDSCRWPIGN